MRKFLNPRRLVPATASLAVLAIFAAPANAQRTTPVTVQNDEANAVPICRVEDQFVGFSATTTSGAAGGTGNMHDMCAATFPGSRQCTASEALNNANAVEPPTGSFGWVYGQFSVAANPTLEFQPFFMVEQATGLAREVNRLQVVSQNCGQWVSSASTIQALTFGRPISSAIGARILYTACSSAHPVACCAAKAVCPN